MATGALLSAHPAIAQSSRIRVRFSFFCFLMFLNTRHSITKPAVTAPDSHDRLCLLTHVESQWQSFTQASLSAHILAKSAWPFELTSSPTPNSSHWNTVASLACTYPQVCLFAFRSFLGFHSRARVNSFFIAASFTAGRTHMTLSVSLLGVEGTWRLCSTDVWQR